MTQNFLVLDPQEDIGVLKSLASSVRIGILRLLHERGGMNVNEIARVLGLPQSSISSNIQILEEAGLLRSEARRATKGSQKVCHPVYDEILVVFKNQQRALSPDEIQISMPLGLYTNCAVTAPCGICSPEGIIGLLDVPDNFLNPDRMKAALLWFTSGFVEYQFPNNAKLNGSQVESVEFSMELSSEVPGTASEWPSDITVSVNGVELGIWTSPGDFGDKRGVYTPGWWKLARSQYGMLKSWSVNRDGSFVDGMKISDVSIDALDLDRHRSIRLRIEVKPDARHPGGVNIFGRGFGNYDQDIVMRLRTKR